MSDSDVDPQALTAQRILKLGALVALTGADALDEETLAGALLMVVLGIDIPDLTMAWRADGAAFLTGRRRGASAVAPPSSVTLGLSPGKASEGAGSGALPGRSI